MKYILHDTNAASDEKLSELFIKFGYEGLGLFWCILEKIGSQEKPIKTGVLKSQLKVGKKLERCWSFMENLGLISVQNDETFNERILSYSEKYQIQKQKTKDRVEQWRENKRLIESVTVYERGGNAPKVKESKVNKDKGVSISRESKEVVFSDGTKQPLGESQILELEQGTLSPRQIFRGTIQ